MDQDETRHGGRRRPRPHYMLDGDPTSGRKGHSSPHFSAHGYCGQTAGWTKMPLGTEVGLVLGDMLDEEQAPPEKGPHPHFSAHVYCGQTAGWIKMPLGTEIRLCLSQGHIVLDGWGTSSPAPVIGCRSVLSIPYGAPTFAQS